MEIYVKISLNSIFYFFLVLNHDFVIYIVLWSDTWQLLISINKCCLLNVGKNFHGIVVSIGGSTLPVVTHTRDLGIIVSIVTYHLFYMSLILFLKHTCVLV